MAKESAEQKLLKLIEASDSSGKSAGSEASASAGESASVNPAAQKMFQAVHDVGVSGVALPAGINNLLDSIKGIFSGKSAPALGLRSFNHVLALGVVALAFFLAVDFTKNMNSSQSEIRRILGGGLTSTAESNDQLFLPIIKDFNEYAKAIERRNIFQPYEEKVAEAKKESSPEEKLGIGKISEQTKDLKLVGISWLDTPDSASAMIENTASGTTYFLGQGDNIQSVTVKKIFADSIVVSDGQEEMEIKL